MNPIAKIGFLIKGNYSNEATYDFLDIVFYNGASYVAKKLTTGNTPARSNEYWQIFAEGTTISDVSDASIIFNQATNRVNVASGEKLSVFAGKVKKFFADLKTVAFTGKYSDLKEKLPLINNFLTTEAGAGAADAKTIADLKNQMDAKNSDFANSLNQINSDLKRILIATTDTVDLANVGILNTGVYTISKSTLNKPDGVLDFGIMLVMARGSNKTGFIISWNGGASKIMRLHVFASSDNHFTQVN